MIKDENKPKIVANIKYPVLAALEALGIDSHEAIEYFYLTIHRMIECPPNYVRAWTTTAERADEKVKGWYFKDYFPGTRLIFKIGISFKDNDNSRYDHPTYAVRVDFPSGGKNQAKACYLIQDQVDEETLMRRLELKMERTMLDGTDDLPKFGGGFKIKHQRRAAPKGMKLSKGPKDVLGK